MSEKPTEKLTAVLGFDPTKRTPLTNTLFKEVLAEIQDAKQKEAKVKAKELLTKAITIREELDKLNKTFQTAYNKNEKELGKVLNSISSMLAGREEEENKELVEV